MKIEQWITLATRALAESEHLNLTFAEAKREAIIFLQYGANIDAITVVAFPEREINASLLTICNDFLQRRILGEPVAYLLGNKSFWDLDLCVSKDTLIPRPDTEVLVEASLRLIEQSIQAKQADSHKLLNILDLGCGTGAIALAIMQELDRAYKNNPQVNYCVTGVDRINKAVELAKNNAKRNKLEAKFLESNWFNNLLGKKFDFIVSNPPYIDKNDPHLQQGDVRFEPVSALVAEKNGLADIEIIIDSSLSYLNEGGYLLLEHGWQQAESVKNLFAQHGEWQNIQTVMDYGHRPRVTLAQKLENR